MDKFIEMLNPGADQHIDFSRCSLSDASNCHNANYLWAIAQGTLISIPSLPRPPGRTRRAKYPSLANLLLSSFFSDSHVKSLDAFFISPLLINLSIRLRRGYICTPLHCIRFPCLWWKTGYHRISDLVIFFYMFISLF